MAAPITLDSEVSVTNAQVSCELSGETVVLSLATGHYFGLNLVGGRIWELLQASRSLIDVRDTLVREFPDVAMDRCTADLLSIVADLVEADLLELR